MVLGVDKIYITHWSKLKERRELLLCHLEEKKIHNFEFIEIYDIENWLIDEIKKEYPLIFGPNINGIYLKYSEISLALKHCYIIKDALKNNYSSIMIFEDDVRLNDFFIEDYNNYVNQLPNDWDLFFFGTCCDLHINNTSEKINVYKTNKSRCCHAYSINNSGIIKLEKKLSLINNAIDWYYNYIISELKLNTFWSEPAIAFQSNEFSSTIQK